MLDDGNIIVIDTHESIVQEETLTESNMARNAKKVFLQGVALTRG